MIRNRWVAFILCFLLCIPCLCVCEEEATVTAVMWTCLGCGSDSSGDICSFCGMPKDVWTCQGCGSRNLSDTCRFCGKTREDSLHEQIDSSELLQAWPAVRYLSNQGDGAALCALHAPRYADSTPQRR